MKARRGAKFWMNVHPWLVIGTMAVLVPILVFVTIDRINRHREQTREILVARAEAVILSFEAGIRTGMGMQWTGFQIQKLLLETARQPDIDYLVVTDADGVILADSDPSLVGERYGTELDLPHFARSKTMAWRTVAQTDGADSFEVYRGFFPRGNPSARPGNRNDASVPDESTAFSPSGLVIFVGLDMGPIIASRNEDLRHSIWIGVILLLVGFSAIVSLFLVQGYRTTRASLSRIQTFSAHLVETMPVGLLVLDGQGLITYCNRAAEAILDRSSADLVGHGAARALPPPLARLIVTTAQAGRSEEAVELPVADGKSLSLEVIGSELREDDGTFHGYVILFRDLTEMENLKREVEKSRRLASLGSLAAGVAHEIRNPLSSLKGFATYFKEHHRNDPQEKKTAEIMISEVDRLNRVITQLLDLARPVALNLRQIPPAALLQHALALMEEQARVKGIEIRIELSPGVGEVVIDPDKIEQVILNLLLNAVEAMEAGGVISLSMGTTERGMVRIAVADTGPGIGKEDLPHIFDPYFTTKQSGTGLGLALVHRIVQAHGGEITVESTPGTGTVFTVLLPAAHQSAVHQQGDVSS